MAATSATLDVMVREDTPGRSAGKGEQLRKGLDLLGEKYEWIGEVRGMGLMQALELVEDGETKEASSALAKALMEATKAEGLLLGLGGLQGHVIRLGPSMLVTEDEVADALERLSRACRSVEEDR